MQGAIIDLHNLNNDELYSNEVKFDYTTGSNTGIGPGIGRVPAHIQLSAFGIGPMAF